MCALPLRRDLISTKRYGWNGSKLRDWNVNWSNGLSRRCENDLKQFSNCFRLVLNAIRCATNVHSTGFRRVTNVQYSTSLRFAKSSSDFHPNEPKLNESVSLKNALRRSRERCRDVLSRRCVALVAAPVPFHVR